MYSVSALTAQPVLVEHLVLVSRLLVCDIESVVVPHAPLKPNSTFKVVVVGNDIIDAQGLFAIRVTKYLLLPMCEIFISPPAA